MSSDKPAVFMDGAAPPNEWSIKITLDTIDSVLANTNVDLIPDDQNYQPVFDLVLSPRKLRNVLWECVRKSAETKGVSRDQFCSALDGPAFASGWEALINALVFFIQSTNPQRAKMFESMFEAAMKVRAAENDVQIEILSSQTTDESLRTAIQGIKEQMQKEVSSQLANCASNWRGA